jgi:hypothetical protein
MEYNCTTKILPQIAAQFRPWLENQRATGTPEPGSKASEKSHDGDTEMSDVGFDLDEMDWGDEMDVTPVPAEGSDDATLERLAYKVLGDMLGLDAEAPTRLKMGEYKVLGLNGRTTSGVSYSLRGLASSASAPVTPVKPNRSRKRRRTESPDVETPTQ